MKKRQTLTPEFSEEPYIKKLDTGTGGDPHFVGIHGQLYDVHGEPDKYYNLFTSRSVQMNCRYAGLPNGFTVISEIGIRLSDRKIFMNLDVPHDRPYVTMNPGGAFGMAEDKPVTWLEFFDLPLYRDHRAVVGNILVVPNTMVVNIGLYILEIVRCVEHPGEPHPRFGKLDSPHLDVYFHPSGLDYLTDVMPEGFLGCSAHRDRTSNGGDQGEGILTGVYSNYEVGDLWSTDFRYSLFVG